MAQTGCSTLCVIQYYVYQGCVMITVRGKDTELKLEQIQAHLGLKNRSEALRYAVDLALKQQKPRRRVNLSKYIGRLHTVDTRSRVDIEKTLYEGME